MGIYNVVLITILVSVVAVLIVWLDGRQADSKPNKKKKGQSKAGKPGKKRKLHHA